MKICEKIRYFRTKKGLTQEKLAFEANISVKTVQRAEQGIQVSLEALESLSNALGIDYDDLLHDRKHLSEIRKEFTQQASFIDQSNAFRNEDVLSTMLEFSSLTKDSVVLDLACGTGIVTEALAQLSNHVIAIDITDEMVRKTQDMCTRHDLSHVTVLKGNAEKLNFEDHYFDCIVTRLSIHHFENPLTILKEIKRVLKPDGTVIIADVYVSQNPDEARLHNAIEKLRDPSHTKMLSLDEFQTLFELTAFELSEINYIDMSRSFDEWLKITNAPERYDALFVILENLIQANKSAGIELAFNGSNITFMHHWVIYKLNNKQTSNLIGDLQ